ncbi:MAG: glycosyltransferase [Verrucomicrobiota bacterium]
MSAQEKQSRKSKVRVAHIFLEFPVGGAEDLVRLMLRSEIQIEHRLICLKAAGAIGEELGKEGVAFDCPGWIKGKRFSLPTAFRLSKWLSKNEINIIHSHVYNAHVYAGIAAYLLGLPHVMHHHKTWSRPRLHRQIILHWLNRRAAHHITLSEQTRQDLVSRFQLKPQQVTPLSNPIDCADFYPSNDTQALRSQLQIPRDRFIVGNIASLRVQKNHLTLTKAIELATRKHGFKGRIYLLGEGPERPQLETFIKAHRLSNIILAGNQRPISPWLRALDLMVLPSTWEGQPMVLLQALQCKVPILASRIEAHIDLLGHDHPGLFDALSSDNLAQLLARAENDPQWCQLILTYQDRLAQRLTTIEEYGTELASLYRQVLSEPSPR